jgi:hypothetical protein
MKLLDTLETPESIFLVYAINARTTSLENLVSKYDLDDPKAIKILKQIIDRLVAFRQNSIEVCYFLPQNMFIDSKLNLYFHDCGLQY